MCVFSFQGEVLPPLISVKFSFISIVCLRCIIDFTAAPHIEHAPSNSREGEKKILFNRKKKITGRKHNAEVIANNGSWGVGDESDKMWTVICDQRGGGGSTETVSDENKVELNKPTQKCQHLNRNIKISFKLPYVKIYFYIFVKTISMM